MRRNRRNGGVVIQGARGSADTSWVYRRVAQLVILTIAAIVGLLALFTETKSVSAQEPPDVLEQVEFRESGPVLGGLLTTDGRYVVQADETCWDIAGTFNNAARWRQLLVANTTTISQEANVRGVPFEACPIRPGMVLDVPSHWVPDRFRFVEVPVKDDFSHWKRSMAYGVLGATAFGALVGAAVAIALPTVRRRYRFPDFWSGHKRPKLRPS